MIIAIDHGNKQIKLPGGRVFTSGLRESDTRPPFGDDVLKYNDKYYTITDKRIPYMREKFNDDRFYVLTLFAIAFEIEDTGRYEPGAIRVHVLAGLPPAHFGAQYERFESYFRRGVEEFDFHGKSFKINIYEATAYPQAFAAAVPVLGEISSLPKAIVLDIGGFTADFLMIKHGRADLSDCDSLEHGVIILYNQITAKVNSELNLLLDESDIDTILEGKAHDFGDDVIRVVHDAARVFVSDLFGKLRERAIDLRSGRTVFVGGGSILLKEQIIASGKVASPLFIDSISANAKGYEMLYKAFKPKG
ncbi:MAG: ParM/StbA family protein [Defluviitaleaceae bacterium]|nr:ParM/StbA family protein [Defluviitaleaceae bacterium]